MEPAARGLEIVRVTYNRHPDKYASDKCCSSFNYREHGNERNKQKNKTFGVKRATPLPIRHDGQLPSHDHMALLISPVPRITLDQTSRQERSSRNNMHLVSICF